MAIRKGVDASRKQRVSMGSSSKYLKLTEGDTYLIAFAGVLIHGEDEEPVVAEIVWYETKEGRRSELYDPDKHAEDQIKTNFTWNVAVKDEASGEISMKLLQSGTQIFDRFIKFRDGRKGLKYWFEISREGSGQFDTKYALEIDEKVTPEEMEVFEGLDFIDIVKELESSNEPEEAPKPRREGKRNRKEERKAQAARAVSAPARHSEDEDDEDLDDLDVGDENDTASLEELARIKTALKGAPKTTGKKLAKHFGIKSLGQILSKDVKDVLAFIASESKPPETDDLDLGDDDEEPPF